MRRRARALGAVLRDERGQSIVEWLGVMGVLLVLTALVFAVKPSYGEQLRCAVGAQIDRILTIDQEGECHIDRPQRDNARTRAILRAPAGSAQDRLDRQALSPSTP
jgi:hypothetical protein